MNGIAGPPLPRLGPRLAARPASLRWPARRPVIGIAHLGVGAFHRAHQAAYFDALSALDRGPWGIVGVSLRHPDVAAQLEPQAGLYCLQTLDRDGGSVRVIGAIRKVLYIGADRSGVIRRLATNDIRIVSCTVTEKGYCHRPADGRLDAEHPEIVRDLETPMQPITAPGVLAAILHQRWLAGGTPPTVLCCDNLPRNGTTVASIVRDYARRAFRDEAFLTWLDRDVAFPCTMVDRIVPATTAADRESFAAITGVRDEGLVKAEPFSQWIIERRFAGTPPPLEKVGVIWADSIHPFESMKLRMLNGAHSAIAWLAQLAGIEHVATALLQPGFGRYVEDLLELEVMPTLVRPEGIDLDRYRRDLLVRFANAALAHRTAQIAMDSSQKLPQRLLGTWSDRLARGLPSPRIALAVAGWMRFARGLDEEGRELEVADPLVEPLRRAARASGDDAAALVDAMLGFEQIFPAAVRGAPAARAEVLAAMHLLHREGALGAARRLATEGAAA